MKFRMYFLLVMLLVASTAKASPSKITGRFARNSKDVLSFDIPDEFLDLEDCERYTESVSKPPNSSPPTSKLTIGKTEKKNPFLNRQPILSHIKDGKQFELEVEHHNTPKTQTNVDKMLLHLLEDGKDAGNRIWNQYIEPIVARRDVMHICKELYRMQDESLERHIVYMREIQFGLLRTPLVEKCLIQKGRPDTPEALDSFFVSEVNRIVAFFKQTINPQQAQQQNNWAEQPPSRYMSRSDLSEAENCLGALMHYQQWFNDKVIEQNDQCVLVASGACSNSVHVLSEVLKQHTFKLISVPKQHRVETEMVQKEALKEIDASYESIRRYLEYDRRYRDIPKLVFIRNGAYANIRDVNNSMETQGFYWTHAQMQAGAQNIVDTYKHLFYRVHMGDFRLGMICYLKPGDPAYYKHIVQDTVVAKAKKLENRYKDALPYEIVPSMKWTQVSNDRRCLEDEIAYHITFSEYAQSLHQIWTKYSLCTDTEFIGKDSGQILTTKLKKLRHHFRTFLFTENSIISGLSRGNWNNIIENFDEKTILFDGNHKIIDANNPLSMCWDSVRTIVNEAKYARDQMLFLSRNTDKLLPPYPDSRPKSDAFAQKRSEISSGSVAVAELRAIFTDTRDELIGTVKQVIAVLQAKLDRCKLVDCGWSAFYRVRVTGYEIIRNMRMMGYDALALIGDQQQMNVEKLTGIFDEMMKVYYSGQYSWYNGDVGALWHSIFVDFEAMGLFDD